MYKASSHSLLILLRRAELELVLKRPSDLRRKPNEVFWLLGSKKLVGSDRAADNFPRSYRRRSRCWTAPPHSGNRREWMKSSTIRWISTVNLLGDALLHQEFDTLLHIPDEFLLLLLHTDHPAFLHWNLFANIWNLKVPTFVSWHFVKYSFNLYIHSGLY